jgi:hypothetical protein
VIARVLGVAFIAAGEAENWAKGFAVFMLRFAGIAVAF